MGDLLNQAVTATLQLNDQGEGSFGTVPPEVIETLAASIMASRTVGVSPMTVVFSAAGTVDSVRDSHDVFRENGYYFDFDDLAAENYTYGTNAGLSTNTSVGGPIVSHTFVVPDGGGSVNFNVLVRVKNPEGLESLANIVITCQAQDDYYSAANTICVSNTLSLAADWTTYDTPAPLGAAKQATLPNWDEFDGKRIMLFRGDDFTGEAIPSIIARIGQNNCMVTVFGDDISPKPIVSNVIPGSSNTTGNSTFTDADVIAWGWPNTFTVEKLRTPFVNYPPAYSHLGVYDLDMDFESEPSGGYLQLSNNSEQSYTDPNLSQSNVPFPVGCYAAKCRVVGSTASLPNVNIGAFNAPYLLWAGISDCYARKADEHNLRLMSYQTLAIHDCDLRGEHVGGAGPKSRFTIRSKGHNTSEGDLVGKSREITGQGYYEYPLSQLAVVQRVLDDPSSVGNSTFSGSGPSNIGSLSLIQDVVIRDCTFVNNPTSGLGNIKVAIAGKWMSSVEHTYLNNVSGRSSDKGPDFDLHDTIPLTPAYIDANVPNIPIPTAPR